MNNINLLFKITCASRTVKEQYALYTQGRESLEQVNYLRKLAGMSYITEQENMYKVTWTLNSKHIINLDDGNLENDKSKAFDIVLLKFGKPHWDIKVSVNQNEIPDYNEAGKVGESVGLKWGGRFKKSDMPHFEI